MQLLASLYEHGAHLLWQWHYCRPRAIWLLALCSLAQIWFVPASAAQSSVSPTCGDVTYVPNVISELGLVSFFSDSSPSVDVYWTLGSSTNLQTFYIWRSQDGVNFSPLKDNLGNKISVQPADEGYTDNTVQNQNARYYYQIEIQPKSGSNVFCSPVPACVDMGGSATCSQAQVAPITPTAAASTAIATRITPSAQLLTSTVVSATPTISPTITVVSPLSIPTTTPNAASITPDPTATSTRIATPQGTSTPGETIPPVSPAPTVDPGQQSAYPPPTASTVPAPARPTPLPTPLPPYPFSTGIQTVAPPQAVPTITPMVVTALALSQSPLSSPTSEISATAVLRTRPARTLAARATTLPKLGPDDTGRSIGFVVVGIALLSLLVWAWAGYSLWVWWHRLD